MSLQKKVEQITSQIDHNSFDSVAGGLEKMLDLLEHTTSNDPYLQTAIKKTEELRDEANMMLKKEKAQILKEAEENGISLSGMDSSSDDIPKKNKNKKREVDNKQSKCCILI